MAAANGPETNRKTLTHTAPTASRHGEPRDPIARVITAAEKAEDFDCNALPSAAEASYAEVRTFNARGLRSERLIGIDLLPVESPQVKE
jgi:hypothetical protein